LGGSFMVKKEKKKVSLEECKKYECKNCPLRDNGCLSAWEKLEELKEY